MYLSFFMEIFQFTVRVLNWEWDKIEPFFLPRIYSHLLESIELENLIIL